MQALVNQTLSYTTDFSSAGSVNASHAGLTTVAGLNQSLDTTDNINTTQESTSDYVTCIRDTCFTSMDLGAIVCAAFLVVFVIASLIAQACSGTALEDDVKTTKTPRHAPYDNPHCGKVNDKGSIQEDTGFHDFSHGEPQVNTMPLDPLQASKPNNRFPYVDNNTGIMAHSASPYGQNVSGLSSYLTHPSNSGAGERMDHPMGQPAGSGNHPAYISPSQDLQSLSQGQSQGQMNAPRYPQPHQYSSYHTTLGHPMAPHDDRYLGQAYHPRGDYHGYAHRGPGPPVGYGDGNMYHGGPHHMASGPPSHHQPLPGKNKQGIARKKRKK